MRVLVACEFSGTVRDAFARRGHDAWSCDICPAPGQHIEDDVLKHLTGWDLIIAHPPCRYLSLSGVRWMDDERKRLAAKAVDFFNALYLAPCAKVCIENPKQHKQLTLVAQRSQIIQPWQFGHGEVKETYLWLRGLPHLKSTRIVVGRLNTIHMMPGGKDQSWLRSVTYPGIAQAMAEQWG